jgi:hypothetical protein
MTLIPMRLKKGVVASLLLFPHSTFAAPLPVKGSASTLHTIVAHPLDAASSSDQHDWIHHVSEEGKHALGNTYVPSYTLTEPHPNGKSYSNHEYGNRKGKLFDPDVQRQYVATQLAERHLRHYHDRTIDRNELLLRSSKLAASEDAIQDIAQGKVVRHSDHKGVMLLHHRDMDPDIARRLHEHNAVFDMTRKGHTINYRLTKPLRRHEETGEPLKALSEEERAKMDATLQRHVKNARKALKDSEQQPKLWYNPKTHKAEPDPQRDMEIKRMREENEQERLKIVNRLKRQRSSYYELGQPHGDLKRLKYGH